MAATMDDEFVAEFTTVEMDLPPAQPGGKRQHFWAVRLSFPPGYYVASKAIQGYLKTKWPAWTKDRYRVSRFGTRELAQEEADYLTLREMDAELASVV